jgi:hypothetical protein
MACPALPSRNFLPFSQLSSLAAPAVDALFRVTAGNCRRKNQLSYKITQSDCCANVDFVVSLRFIPSAALFSSSLMRVFSPASWRRPFRPEPMNLR